MTFLPFVKSRRPASYRFLKSCGVEDDDIDQECQLYAARLSPRFQSSRGMTRENFYLTYAVPSAVRSLTRKAKNVRQHQLRNDPTDTRQTDDATYSDTIDTLPDDLRNVVNKHLAGQTLSDDERRLLTKAERRIRELIYVD